MIGSEHDGGGKTEFTRSPLRKQATQSVNLRFVGLAEIKKEMTKSNLISLNKQTHLDIKMMIKKTPSHDLPSLLETRFC